MSWHCSTGQEAQVHPRWCNKTGLTRMSQAKGRKLQTSSLQSIIEVLPNGEKFTSAPCSEQNVDVLLMEVQPIPFWMVSVFCYYGTVVSELVTGLRDTLPLCIQWPRTAACVCTICGHTIVHPQKVTARTWAVPSVPEAALGGRKGQSGRTKLSSEPFTIQHA